MVRTQIVALRSDPKIGLTKPRCGPCKTISPVFEQLASSHSAPGRVAFAKVDTDRNGDITSTYGVSA